MIISPSVISPYKIQTFQSGGEVPFSFGNALKFDGVNDYVNTPNDSFSSLFYNANGKYTVSIWVKPNSLTGAPVIFSSSSLSGKVFFELGTNTNIIYWGASTSFRTYNSVGFTIGNWNHFLITKTANGDNGNLYHNGALISSYTGSFVDSAFVTNQVYFGQYPTGAAKLNGAIDEIAIWNGVEATAQNAIDLYNLGNGALASSVIASPTAYWRMNGTSGDSTAIDEQGTYNGTLNNFDFATCWVAH